MHWYTTLTARQQAGVCLAAVLLATAGGCSTAGGGGDTAGNETVDEVTYLTGFSEFGREAYAHVAKAKGFFADEHVDVSIQPGQGARNMAVLLSGKADFAAVDMTTALTFASRPASAGQFKAVAAVQQRSLIAFMALPGSGITTAKDLAGKTIGGIPGAAPQQVFPLYARLAGFDPTTVRWANVPAERTPQTLAAGKVDAVTQFVVGKQTVKTVAGGREPVVLPLAQYLTDLYGVVIVATTGTIRDRPGLVRRFVAAIVRGVDYGTTHPDEAGKALHDQVPVQDPARAATEMQLMAPYVRLNGQVGVLDEARVARSIAALEGGGIIPAGLKPADVVAFDVAPTPAEAGIR